MNSAERFVVPFDLLESKVDSCQEIVADHADFVNHQYSQVGITNIESVPLAVVQGRITFVVRIDPESRMDCPPVQQLGRLSTESNRHHSGQEGIMSGLKLELTD
eukprot:Lithocolla_globosa_v1_NODE_62_length_7247_cov_17.118503.p6 type:complete len:104 gc:universal NODE_62_length_7247_cov_17.118503:5184-4873(-)